MPGPYISSGMKGVVGALATVAIRVEMAAAARIATIEAAEEAAATMAAESVATSAAPQL